MGARIVVRGLTSLNPNADNQPLFIIDGIPIDNSVNDNASNQRGMSNRAADINPNDIETISILKGAAATGLYGVRAANGAVVITTKSGASGSGLTINAGTSFSAEEINKLPEFQRNYGRGWYGIDDGGVYSASGALIEAQSVVDPSYIFYDNYKNFYRTGGMRDHFFNMSGGKDAFTFYTSVNHTKQEGIIPFSHWGRTSARLRGTAKFSEKFDVEGSVNYSNSGGNRVPHTTMGERLMYWSHTQDIREYENPDGTQIAGILSANPLYNAKYMTYVDDVDRTISNLSFNYKPIDWLRFTYRFGHDFYVDKREEISPGPLGIAGENRSGLSALGFMEQRRFINRVINSNFFATFDKEITPDLRATVRAGHELFETDLNYSYNFGEEFVTPGFYSFSNVTRHVITENTYRRRLIGAYGDASLDYKGFLFLNLTARNDWTSTLPKGNNSFFYPSASMSFVFNEVLNLPNALDYGKLRAAYGQVGKDTDPYRTAATYTTATGFPLNGQVGYVRSASRGSNELVPEMTTTLEFGTELQFFKNRLGIDFTWYKANSKDQILSVPVSNTTGYSQVWINAGEIENKGIELILNGTPVKTNNFRWDATVNFTRNRNMVVDIADGVSDITLLQQNGYVNSHVTMRIAKGRPYGDLYGTSYQRYYEGGQPEGLIYLDKDRPKVIANSGGFAGFPLMNTTNQMVLGNGMPNWLAGIRNTFTYKGVSLSVLIDTRWKIDQFDQYGVWLAAFLKPDYTNDRNDVVIFDGVTPDGQPNDQQVWLGQGLGPDGRDYAAGYYRNIHRVMSENFVYDASYIKLRNATLAYNLPTRWITPLNLKGLSVSASVNNVILWTPWRNFDPESYSTGAGSNATALTGMGYPGARSMFFSLNLTL
ncbi:TonB-linked outer membrane protein, SusC/RagA family [Parapedobacter composti]|uniref:TonB-linked outer membrane protein, SusC/RagA family n=1 Tax=Parapedobacter composti TaxID=623281 RepID=A0A1I1J473_9SPHI|nr:SusC/RagA family TonB-linked outer membrane protein [Parapedobacter composti]SFC43246.1 TonB-linked outer membrane protein, SusC/RagA family [Parapedobacter composti]